MRKKPPKQTVDAFFTQHGDAQSLSVAQALEATTVGRSFTPAVCAHVLQTEACKA